MNEKTDQTWREDIILLKDNNINGVLFLCRENAARSQLAEGIFRHMAPKGFPVFSAGSDPSYIDPLVEKVLSEVGIDSQGLKAKGIDSIDLKVGKVDAVVTLCAEEQCPMVAGDMLRVHWELPDPRRRDEYLERLKEFRLVRDELLKRLQEWFDKPCLH